jgi:hypothetical protein
MAVEEKVFSHKAVAAGIAFYPKFHYKITKPYYICYQAGNADSHIHIFVFSRNFTAY